MNTFTVQNSHLFLDPLFQGGGIGVFGWQRKKKIGLSLLQKKIWSYCFEDALHFIVPRYGPHIPWLSRKWLSVFSNLTHSSYAFEKRSEYWICVTNAEPYPVGGIPGSTGFMNPYPPLAIDDTRQPHGSTARDSQSLNRRIRYFWIAMKSLIGVVLTTHGHVFSLFLASPHRALHMREA